MANNNGSSHHSRTMSIRDLLKTPQACRQGGSRPEMEVVGFREDAGFSQFENRYSADSEELTFYKAKCEELQQELDRSQEETRNLQLELVSEKSNMEHYQRTVQAQIEKINAEHRTAIFSVKLEAENWKKTVDNVSAEVQVLQENLRRISKSKAADAKKLTELEGYKADAEKYKRNIQIYIGRHQGSMADLKRKIDQLKKAELHLEDVLNAQKKQIAVFNIVVPALDRQKKLDNAKIFELEKEVLRLQQCLAQQLEKVKCIVTSKQDSESLIKKLKEENQELLQGVNTMTDVLNRDADIEVNLLKRTCESILEQVKESSDNLEVEESMEL